MDRIIALTVLLVSVSAYPLLAQPPDCEPCDFNCNGVHDTADLVLLIEFFRSGGPPIDSLDYLWQLGDCDRDGLHLTLADIIALYRRLIAGYGYGWGRAERSPDDTVYIPDASASPGEEVVLPVYLATQDTLHGLQFFLEYDPEIVEMLEFFHPDTLPDNGFLPANIFDGGISAVTFDPGPDISDYPLGFLRLNILPDIPPVSETALEFNQDRYRALYTGYVLVDTTAEPFDTDVRFVSPVQIGSIIEIVTTDAGDLHEPLKDALRIAIRPNPFNLSTIVKFYVDEDSHVEIAVFDLLGRRVSTLVEERFPPGYHETVWTASELPSGIYFCRLRANEGTATARMTLLK